MKVLNLAAAAVLVAGSASAVTFSDSFGPELTNSSGVVTLPFYDGSLPLIGVHIELAVDFDSEGTVTNTGGTAAELGALTMYMASLTDDDMFPVGTGISADAMDMETYAATAPGGSAAVSLSGSGTSGVISLPNVMDFVGSGTFDLSYSQMATAFFSSGNGNASGVVDTSGSGIVTITYKTEVIPVPGALPLLATGLAGLGFLARRRKV